MSGREFQAVKNTGGEIFPRERNGYAAAAVNNYIEQMNRRFDEIVYEYKRQIVELKRELETVSAESADDISADEFENLSAQLAESQSRIISAEKQISDLTAERDELRLQFNELSADAAHKQISILLDDKSSSNHFENLYEITSAKNLSAPDFYAAADEPGKSFAETDFSSVFYEPILENGDPDSMQVLSYEFQETPDETESSSDTYADDGLNEFDIVSEADGELVCWPSLDSACLIDDPDSQNQNELPDSSIYEIKRLENTKSDYSSHADDILADAARRAAEIIAGARGESKQLVILAEEEANKLRSDRLLQTKEEVRVIKRESYLRARLMLQRINRKLNLQVDACCKKIIDSGLNANRDFIDFLTEMRVVLDDLNYTSLDRAAQIIEEFRLKSNVKHELN